MMTNIVASGSDIQYNDDDDRTKILQETLESSKEGLTKQQMLDSSGLSYQQLREITAGAG